MKAKININRPHISSEEIAKGRSFKAVLEQYQAPVSKGASNGGSSQGSAGSSIAKAVKPFFKNIWFISGVSISTVALVTTLLITQVFNQTENDSDLAELNNSDLNDLNNTEDYDATSLLTSLNDAANAGSNMTGPFIRPVGKATKNNFEKFKVKGTKGSVIKSKSGSTITIPGSAFVDKNGIAINGEVEVQYREFKDHVDFIMSGIPMDYDSAGTHYAFESAGMIEIWAYKDGKPVYIHPDKSIDVEMCSDQEGTKYNLYYLDTVSREWLYKGKDKVRMVSMKEDGNGNYIINSGTNKDSIDSKKDGVLSLEQRKAEFEKEPEMVMKHKNIQTIKVDIKKLEENVPLKPKKASKDEYTFKLDADPDEFPELQAYDSLEFEVKKGQNFTSSIFKIDWEDVEIKETKGGSNAEYSITLIRTGEKKTFDIFPVFSQGNYENAMEIYREKHKQYQELLTKRKDDEKKEQSEYEAKIAEMERRWEEEVAARQKLMQEMETKRSIAQNSINQVTRAFTVNNFGIWNCDHPSNYPKGQALSAIFTDKNGKDLKFTAIYLVEKNRNAIFTYHPGQFNRLEFNPRATNMIYGVTFDNEMCFYNWGDFRQIPKDSKIFTFKMDVPTEPLLTDDDVKSYVGLN